MFNLSYIILDRADLQSVDAFGSAILDDDDNDLDEAPHGSDADLEDVRSLPFLTDHFSD